jgi:hypothetical protein
MKAKFRETPDSANASARAGRAGAACALICCLALGAPVLAQDSLEGDEDEGKLGQIFLEAGVWIAQTAGVEFDPVTISETDDPFDTRLVGMEHGTETRFRYRAGYEFRSNIGAIIATWYTHEENLAVQDLRPGQYVFGEILAYPLFAGYLNDGLSDGYSADGRTVLRDFRIDFSRTAFRSPRAEGSWFIGYRRIQHKQSLEAEYFAILNSLPPLSPPRPDLQPLPDTVSMESALKSRGLEAGMDFLFPVYKNELMVEAGFLVAALRGDLNTTYRATNSLYILDPDNAPAEVLAPPYVEFETQADDIFQQVVGIGLRAESREMSSDILELYLGLRWRAWRDLEVFGGWRQARYNDVSTRLRPKVSTDQGGLNVQDADEYDGSVTYEGFYGGVSYSF